MEERLQRLEQYKQTVLQGNLLEKAEALELAQLPLEPLCQAADAIRRAFCGNAFDLCTIINGKSGRCSEDCKYCAQSAWYHTTAESYPLLSTETLLEQAVYNDNKGVPRYSIVTSGRSLNQQEVDQVCDSIRTIKQKTKISVCASFGLLDEEQFRQLKEAGVSRIHNNLESSRQYFASVCTTHSYDDKLEAIAAAKRAGLTVCSGGIMGLGETMEDRIDLALTLRELGVKSIPVNLLNPIAGTPYENNKRLTNDDLCRIVAVFRFLLPDAFIRLAGGRGLLPDKGRRCFCSGANAAISGDMLTTSGITIEQDMQLLRELQYEVVQVHD